MNTLNEGPSPSALARFVCACFPRSLRDGPGFADISRESGRELEEEEMVPSCGLLQTLLVPEEIEAAEPRSDSFVRRRRRGGISSGTSESESGDEDDWTLKLGDNLYCELSEGAGEWELS